MNNNSTSFRKFEGWGSWTITNKLMIIIIIIVIVIINN